VFVASGSFPGRFFDKFTELTYYAYFYAGYEVAAVCFGATVFLPPNLLFLAASSSFFLFFSSFLCLYAK
jgi:hypothetical protein